MHRLILLLIFICPFGLSAQIENYSGGLQGQKMDWLFHYLSEYYVDEVDNDTLAQMAILRIVEELDPFSRYQSKEQVEAQKNSDKGYSPKAVGFNFYMLNDTALVTYISRKGPAEKAGLKRGDQILSINGFKLVGNYRQLKSLVDSKDIDELDIKVKRYKTTQQVKLVKDRVPRQSIPAAYMMHQTVGYIKLANFTLKTMEEFYPTMEYLKSLGMQELVLDLRGNLGGVKDQALALADEFLPAEKLVYTQSGFNSEQKKYFTSKSGVWEKGKLTIVQDRKTASASEIFIGAMRDWDRAVIIGTTTYGKGYVQQSYGLGDGSNIRLTIGRYLTPTGLQLQRASFDKEDIMLNYKDALYQNSMTRDLNLTKEMRSRTMGGREVIIGEGGIVPDVYYVPPVQDTELIDYLKKSGYLYQFTTGYVQRNRAAMLAEYRSVRAFLNDRVREAFMLKELREYLEKNTPSTQLPSNFPGNIIGQCKTWISSQLWHDNAYYEALNSRDKTLFRSIEISTGKIHNNLGIRY